MPPIKARRHRRSQVRRRRSGRRHRRARRLRSILALTLMGGGAVTGLWLHTHLARLPAPFMSASAMLLIATGASAMVARRRENRGYRVTRRFARLTPRGFELAVAALLPPMGYTDVRHVGGPGDLGVDILCRDREGRSVAVQCKHNSPRRPVRSPEIQTFIGMMTVHHGAERGIVVTTSTFTEPAAELARRHRVALVDRASLARLVRTRGRPPVEAARGPERSWLTRNSRAGRPPDELPLNGARRRAGRHQGRTGR
jgi:HJR/Mrr/RecB family endonuclease